MAQFKNIIIKIIVILFGEIIILIYGDVLKLKKKITMAPSDKFLTRLLIKVYERKLYKMGSWISYKTKIGEYPVFPMVFKEYLYHKML